MVSFFSFGFPPGAKREMGGNGFGNGTLRDIMTNVCTIVQQCKGYFPISCCTVELALNMKNSQIKLPIGPKLYLSMGCN